MPTIKLSEAILLGIGIVKAAPLHFLATGKDQCLTGCTLGTGAYAAGYQLENKDILTYLHKTWPWLNEPHAIPVDMGLSDIQVTIYHANGYHQGPVIRLISLLTVAGISRERIAQWITTIEPQDPQPTTLEVLDEASTVSNYIW